MQKDYFPVSIPIHESVNPGKLLRLTKICLRDRSAKKDMFNKIIDSNGGILKRFQVKKNSKKTYGGFIDNYFYPHHEKTPKYDLQKYHPCYKREYLEIRKEVQELVHSYVILSNSFYKNGRPYHHDLKRHGTRRMNYQRPNGKRLSTGTCIVRNNGSKLTCYWLEVYDYFNEDHLRIPLRCNKGLQKFFFKYGISFDLVKTVTIVRRKYKKNMWIANFTFNMGDINHKKQRTPSNYVIPVPPKCGNQAFLSLDAGQRMPYVGIFATPLGLKPDLIRYYKVSQSQLRLHFLDLRIAKLQNRINTKINELQKLNKGIKSDKNWEYFDKDIRTLKFRLARVRNNWFNIRKQTEEQLASQIVDELITWKEKGWNIKLIVGDLTGIKENRMSHLKDKNQRRRLSRWMYRNRLEILQRKCIRAGIEFYPISEEFTSHTCPNCGVTEFKKASGSKKRRNKLMKNFAIQRSSGYFKCNQCLWSSNADLVGAINIAKKFMVEYYQASDKLLKQALKRAYYYYQDDLYNKQLKKNPNATRADCVTWDWIKVQKIYSKQNGSKIGSKSIEVSLNKFRLKWFNRPHAVPKSLEIWVQSIRIPQMVN